MGKLEFCVRTSELQSMMLDGRETEARRATVQLLNDGFHTKAFLRFVAGLLDPPARKKGAPARPPRQWLNIGRDFEELRDGGVTHEAAVLQLAQKFHHGERTIERAVKIYRVAKAIHDTAE